MEKQVEKSHYAFARYVHKRRWSSMWHQIDEVLRFAPERVLEVGPGPGVFKAVCSALGVAIDTADIDPELNPDHTCSVLDLPFEDALFDVTCAFQVLEHMPLDDSMKALAELGRVARKAVVISLPDADPAWPVVVTLPRLGKKSLLLRRPFFKPRKHLLDREHHWEINKLGYSLEEITSRFASIGHLNLVRTYRVEDYPYHRFFVFERIVPAPDPSEQ